MTTCATRCACDPVGDGLISSPTCHPRTSYGSSHFTLHPHLGASCPHRLRQPNDDRLVEREWATYADTHRTTEQAPELRPGLARRPPPVPLRPGPAAVPAVRPGAGGHPALLPDPRGHRAAGRRV